VPSKEQVDGLTAELSERGKDIPPHVHKVLQALPPGTHPMTQFSTAVLALQAKLPAFLCFCLLPPHVL
jgi:citrate synthase